MILSIAFGLTLVAAAPAETCVAEPAKGHTGASSLPWYVNGEEIAVKKGKYAKFGLPRVLAKGDVSPFAPYKGGFAYVETGSAAATPEVLYVLTDLANCEFQPYMLQQ